MPHSQRPIYLQMSFKNRLTRRQAEALLKALSHVDEREIFEPVEIANFQKAFDKLALAWRDAIKREEERPEHDAKSSRLAFQKTFQAAGNSSA